MPEVRHQDGIAVDAANHVVVSIAGVSAHFALSPEELRQFAAALQNAADRMELEAAGEATDAIMRARRPH